MNLIHILGCGLLYLPFKMYKLWNSKSKDPTPPLFVLFLHPSSVRLWKLLRALQLISFFGRGQYNLINWIIKNNNLQLFCFFQLRAWVWQIARTLCWLTLLLLCLFSGNVTHKLSRVFGALVTLYVIDLAPCIYIYIRLQLQIVHSPGQAFWATEMPSLQCILLNASSLFFIFIVSLPFLLFFFPLCFMKKKNNSYYIKHILKKKFNLSLFWGFVFCSLFLFLFFKSHTHIHKVVRVMLPKQGHIIKEWPTSSPPHPILP